MIKAAIISTVSGPIEELRLFVNYHLNIGVDYIILFLDDHLDERIEFFSQHEQVCIIQCSSDYWLEKTGKRPDSVNDRQIINVNEGVKIALSRKCNWIIHIDRDELIYPLKNMKQVLSKSNAEAVKLYLMEAVSNHIEYDHIFIPTLFKKRPNKYQMRAAKLLGCSNAIFDDEYLRGHSASKMAVKISPDIKHYDVHNAQKVDGNLVVENTKDIQLLHYDCIGVKDWMVKWNKRLTAGKVPIMRPNRDKQFSLYRQAKKEGPQKLSLLYQRLYCIPMRERIILYILGMLKVVKLNQELFEYQDNKANNSVQLADNNVANWRKIMVKTAIISTVRTSIEVLHLFVNYHLNIGVDYFIFFFDDPSDEGIEFFSQYERVCTVACSSDYWMEKTGKRPDSFNERQIINVNEGVKIALSRECNWIIHIDHDELIHPLKEMKQVLSNSNAEAVRFYLMEAVSENKEYDHIFMPKLFKRKSKKIQILVAKFLGCSNAIFDNEYFRGHRASKMAVKISPNIKIYRTHKAIKYKGKLDVENTKDIQLLHYNCIGIKDWMSKWDMRLEPYNIHPVMRPNRNKQFLLYKQAKKEGLQKLSLLYQRLHCIPMRERKILDRLGMLKVVQLNQKLFGYRDSKN